MSHLRWAGLALSCLLATSGCLRTSVDVPPTPPEPDIARIARNAIHDYAAGLATSFATTADQLAAGELTTAAETNTQLQSANASARRQAFLPLDEALNAELGGERWDAQRAVRIFREIAEGLNAISPENERESLEAITPSP